ncbi:MAG: hypothetical protein K1X57_03325 [Gemmataceae bacterium]|nr:hypothetical protein [Gemmataceae bacterium]
MRTGWNCLNLLLVIAAARVACGVDLGLSDGHAEAAYRGWRATRAAAADRWCGVDLRVDAGQPFVVGLAMSGPWARFWCGSDQNGPDLGGYSRARCWAVVLVPVLAGIAAINVQTAGAWLVPWIVLALWSLRPNVLLFDSGYVELSFVGPIAGLYLAGLRRFHLQPNLAGWAMVAFSSGLGWYFVPTAWLAFSIPATAAWLFVAARHTWPWHALLVLSILVGAAPSFAAWHEIYRQSAFASEVVPAELRRVWLAIGESTTSLATLAVIHLAISVAPWLVETAVRRGLLIVGFTVASSAAIAIIQSESTDLPRFVSWWQRPCPAVTRTDEWWSALAARTDDSARLLTEASDEWPSPSEGYLALVRQNAPVLVGVRSEGEHTPWAFSAGRLGGRSVSEWTDDEFGRFFDRWNIGWVMVRSPATISRLGRLPSAVRLPLPFRADGTTVFALNRKRSYVILGKGRLSMDDRGDVIVSDVVPDRNSLVLSLRHYPGWSASPGRVLLESEVDPYDPWPLVRLRLSGPFGRIVLHPGGS